MVKHHTLLHTRLDNINLTNSNFYTYYCRAFECVVGHNIHSLPSKYSISHQTHSCLPASPLAS